MDGGGGLIVGACALAHCASCAFVSRHMFIARISLQTGPAYANIALKECLWALQSLKIGSGMFEIGGLHCWMVLRAIPVQKLWCTACYVLCSLG